MQNIFVTVMELIDFFPEKKTKYSSDPHVHTHRLHNMNPQLNHWQGRAIYSRVMKNEISRKRKHKIKTIVLYAEIQSSNFDSTEKYTR